MITNRLITKKRLLRGLFITSWLLLILFDYQWKHNIAI